jgi:uncharacterized protein YndB with AHSA1/START domain
MPMRSIVLLAGIVIAIIIGWIIATKSRNLSGTMKHNVMSTFADSSIQAGVRKTFLVPLPEVWDYLVSPAGINTWLGIEDSRLLPGKTFTNGAIQGEIKVIKDLSHIRMIWKRTSWPTYSTLQIRVFRAEGGTTISFHQDKLAAESVRAEMILHWDGVLRQVDKRLRLSEN